MITKHLISELGKRKNGVKRLRGMRLVVKLYVMFYAIWYHLYNLKNVKNSHGGVLLSLQLY